MLYIQESGSIRLPINAGAFPLVYSLLSLFVTQSEAYTNIGVAPESACAKSTRARSVASACAKILARALRYDLGARRLITARAELCRRVVSLMRWFRFCSLTVHGFARKRIFPTFTW